MNSMIRPGPKLWIARTLAYFFRFRTLQVTEWSLSEFATLEQDNIVPVNLFGFRLPLRISRSITHRLLCVEGERFIQERFLLSGLLNKSDRVIDVGANIGYLSLLFQQAIGPSGKLICVEPDPENFVELQRCFGYGQFKNTTLMNAAIGETEELVHLNPGLNGHVSSHGPVSVQQITLDSLNRFEPSFIKIDVEGYEGKVIAGARQLLAEHRPTLFLELHPGLVPDRSDIRQIVESLDAIYDSIQFRIPAGACAKCLMRYGMTSAIAEIEDRQSLLSRVECSQRDQPFWAVCRVRTLAAATSPQK